MSRLASFLLIMFLLSPLPALALTSNWQRDGSVDARLISGLEGVGLKKIIPLALEIKMEPGWHTYWRSPGAAGLPPRLDWTNSETADGNLRGATIFYPAPKRYSDQGLETIGYQSHVIFPIDAELRQAGHAVNIEVTVNLLACSTLCVPKTFDITLKVPSDAAIEGPEADLINPVRAAIPGADEDRAGLSLTNITNGGRSLAFDIAAHNPINEADIFIESNPEIPFSAPKIRLSPDKLTATLIVKPQDIKQDLGALTGTPLMLTIVDEGHALETPVSLPPLEGTPTQDGPPLSLRMALLLAIAGGFILNLMPCVLPVLSLKILGVIGHGGGTAAIVRRSFVTTAAGILFSFVMLAAMTIALKKLGLTIGWGVQFQQPGFLIAVILVLTFFAANMWGLFEIGLPTVIADRLSHHHPKMAGDFATGALATLLATPCSAPFLGTAITFALAAGTAREIFGIFIALGFGMSLPYIAIAAIPELATSLPKPGAWMQRLRILLGIALALTALWLLWVLSAQIEQRYAHTIMFCMIGVVALLGLHATGFARRMAIYGVAGFSVLAIGLAFTGPPPKPAKVEALWQVFDEATIADDVAGGHTVFVDITADWCLTCKVNKKFVLSDNDINQRLLHGNVIPMQGDWTTPDPKITNFLHKFSRFGIPFNVVYGPGAPDGITLPELLSRDAVMQALDRAAKPEGGR